MYQSFGFRSFTNRQSQVPKYTTIVITIIELFIYVINSLMFGLILLFDSAIFEQQFELFETLTEVDEVT
jgi:hypothetical protein